MLYRKIIVVACCYDTNKCECTLWTWWYIQQPLDDFKVLVDLCAHTAEFGLYEIHFSNPYLLIFSFHSSFIHFLQLTEKL